MFQQYFLDTRGPNDIPERFLKTAQRGTVNRVTGYYAQSALIKAVLTPIEFNHSKLCWVEVKYRRTERWWHAYYKRAASDLGLDIPISELTSEETLLITRDSVAGA